MGENPTLENCYSPDEAIELEQMGTQKNPVSDQPNNLQFTNIKSDSFIVDVERLSHLTNKEVTANSKFTLQRSLSRKGSQQRSSEKKTNPSNDNERESNTVASDSPRATLAGASMLEKQLAGPEDRPSNPQAQHHQITIKTGGATTAESRITARRYGFRRSQPSTWTFHPRKIFFFLATLSSMGTILLIYFTLSMGRLSGDDSAQNW